jgi:molybdopterin-guanine dinucleotide biosynthesis protein A
MHLHHILYDNPSMSNQITTLIHIEFRLFRASILDTLNDFLFQKNVNSGEVSTADCFTMNWRPQKVSFKNINFLKDLLRKVRLRLS